LRSSAILVLLLARNAAAFDDPGQFLASMTLQHSATLSASAEGLYFTGSPRFAGLDCSSCHTDGPNKIDISVNTDQLDLFNFGYQAGQTYEIQVQLKNEQEGIQFNTKSGLCTEPPATKDTFTYQQCNNNNFALEIDSITGPLTGFCAQKPSGGACPNADPFNDEVFVVPQANGGDAVFANRIHDPTMPKTVRNNGETAWHLWWTAPAAGTGPLTLYVALVDGNGGGGVAADDQDPLGDDTVTAIITIPEAGAPVSVSPKAGCGLTLSDGFAQQTNGGTYVVGILLLASEILRRRRRRPGRARPAGM
jgi:hypothetical protein